MRSSRSTYIRDAAVFCLIEQTRPTIPPLRGGSVGARRITTADRRLRFRLFSERQSKLESLDARWPRAFSAFALKVGSSHRSAAAVFRPTESTTPELPPLRGSCAYDRKVAFLLCDVVFLRAELHTRLSRPLRSPTSCVNGRGVVGFGPMWRYGVLNGCVEFSPMSPPRSGGFQSARRDVAATSAAKRRLCVGARRCPAVDRRRRCRRFRER